MHRNDSRGTATFLSPPPAATVRRVCLCESLCGVVSRSPLHPGQSCVAHASRCTLRFPLRAMLGEAREPPRAPQVWLRHALSSIPPTVGTYLFLGGGCRVQRRGKARVPARKLLPSGRLRACDHEGPWSAGGAGCGGFSGSPVFSSPRPETGRSRGTQRLMPVGGVGVTVPGCHRDQTGAVPGRGLLAARTVWVQTQLPSGSSAGAEGAEPGRARPRVRRACVRVCVFDSASRICVRLFA